MARLRSTTLRTYGFGAALTALTVFACLLIAGANDPKTCTLAELQSRESVLMSCADAGPVSAGVMWCSDPSSPHCIPAVPQAPRPELWDHTFAVMPSLPSLPRLGYVWMTWPEADVPDLQGRTSAHRLERPPRA